MLNLLTVFCASFSGDTETIQKLELRLRQEKDRDIFIEVPPSKDETYVDENTTFEQIYGFNIPKIGE